MSALLRPRLDLRRAFTADATAFDEVTQPLALGEWKPFLNDAYDWSAANEDLGSSEAVDAWLTGVQAIDRDDPAPVYRIAAPTKLAKSASNPSVNKTAHLEDDLEFIVSERMRQRTIKQFEYTASAPTTPAGLKRSGGYFDVVRRPSLSHQHSLPSVPTAIPDTCSSTPTPPPRSPGTVKVKVRIPRADTIHAFFLSPDAGMDDVRRELAHRGAAQAAAFEFFPVCDVLGSWERWHGERLVLDEGLRARLREADASLRLIAL